jgi:hypothetical protein
LFQVFLGVCRLSVDSMDDTLDDIFSWSCRLKVLNKLQGFSDFLVLEVIDDKVESGFREDIDERWKDLED